MMVFTLFGSLTTVPLWSTNRGSFITDWNFVTSVNSATELVAVFMRSIDFGVNTTSGRFKLPKACRRSRWK